MREIVMGGAGGAIVAVGLWFVVSRVIDQQFKAGIADVQPAIRAAVQAEVPPQVRATIEQTFREYGITPEVGNITSKILGGAAKIGIL